MYLIRLGIPPGQAFAWSRPRKGGWAVAQSPMLVTTITLKRLVKRGYESLLDYYRKVSPQITNRCMRDPLVQWCERRSLLPKGGRAVYSLTLCFSFSAFLSAVQSVLWYQKLFQPESLFSAYLMLLSLFLLSFLLLLPCRVSSSGPGNT
jgi:hypothetical protein